MKLSALSILAAGALLSPGCSLTDIRDNMVAGSLGFVKSYTSEMLGVIIPNADTLFPPPAAQS